MAILLVDWDYDETRRFLLRTSPQILTPTYPSGTPPIPTNAFDRLEYLQAIPLALWIWNHNLGYKPVPQILNLAGQQIVAQIEHPSANQIRVSFNPGQAGWIVI